MSSLLPNKGDNAIRLSAHDDPSIEVSSKEKSSSPNIAGWRFVLAFIVALAADTIGIPFGESLNIVFDVIIAIILIAILGFNWMLIPALLVECVPGLGVFPTWVMAVLAIAGWKTINRK